MGAESSGQDGKAMAFSEPGLLLSFRPNQGTSVRIGGRFPADGGERVGGGGGGRTRYVGGGGNGRGLMDVCNCL